MPSISCVLPLRQSDFSRFDLLRRTFEKFVQFETNMTIVVPEADLSMAESEIGTDAAYRIVCETSLIPELSTSNVDGWWKQQAIKLAFCEVCETDFYLTLDADCLMVRPIRESDLIVNGKAIVQYEPSSTHEDWYAASAIELNMPIPPGDSVGATPFVMSRHIAQRLWSHLEHLYGDGCTPFLHAKGCTEYTLYHVFGSHEQLWDEFHIGCSTKLYANCIWHAVDADRWNAADSFETKNQFFSVLQSNANVDPAWVWKRIRSYLE